MAQNQTGLKPQSETVTELNAMWKCFKKSLRSAPSTKQHSDQHIKPIIFLKEFWSALKFSVSAECPIELACQVWAIPFSFLSLVIAIFAFVYSLHAYLGI